MKIIKKSWENILAIICVLLFFIAFGCLRQPWGQPQESQLSNIFLFMTLVVYFILNFLLFQKKSDFKIFFQCLIINLIFALFVNLAFFVGVSNRTWLSYIELAIFNFLTFLFLVGLLEQKIRINAEKRHMHLIIIFTIFTVLSADTFSILPKWDALVYYDALWDGVITKIPENFDFTLNSFIAFKLQSHYSFGYAFLAAIGEFIGQGEAYGVILVHLIVTLVSIGCFYGLLNYFVPKYQESANILATCIYCFSPCVLGNFFNITLDYFIVYLYIILFYLEIKNCKYLFFLVAILFVFTKEPAVIVYGIFYICTWIYNYFNGNNKFNLKQIQHFVCRNIEKIFITSFPILLFLLALWIQHGSYFGHWDIREYDSLISTADNSNINYFGFTLENLLIKCKQIFLLNFSWLFCMIIFALLILKFLKKIRGSLIQEKRKLYVLIIPILSNFAFNIFYITNPTPRYNALCVTGLYFCGIFCLYECLRNEKKLCIIVSLLSILMFAQTYTSIDPLTNHMFVTQNVGGTKVVNATDTVFSAYDRIETNKSYIYLEQALEKAYQDIAHENPIICIDNFCGNKALQLWGDYSNYGRSICWNPEKQRFSLNQMYEEVRLYEIDATSITTLNSDKVYYFKVNWDDTRTLKLLSEKYKNRTCKTFIHMGWQIERYTFQIK